MIRRSKVNLHFRRFEFKYVLPTVVADKIIPCLSDYTVVDDYAKSNGFYFVNGLYFDSPQLKCYQEKIDGVNHRKKYRLRWYSEDSQEPEEVFWEIKRKDSAVVIKDRILAKYGDLLDLDYVNLAKKYHHQRKFLDEFFYDYYLFHLKPKVFIKYKRLPFFAMSNPNFRVTLDYDLQSQPAQSVSFERKPLSLVLPEYAVLEVKFNGRLPWWFAKIIRAYDLQRDSFSKYAHSVEKLLQCNHRLV